MRTAVDMKRCYKCTEIKPRDQFYKSRSRRDGLDPRCKDCQKAYRAGRRGEIAAYNSAYYAENREGIKAGVATYRTTPEGRASSWRGHYREKCKRLGLEPGVIEMFTAADVILEYGDKCVYCGTGPFDHLDHAMPISRGGDHTLQNCVPACEACNLDKRDRTPGEWAADKALADAELDAMTDNTEGITA